MRTTTIAACLCLAGVASGTDPVHTCVAHPQPGCVPTVSFAGMHYFVGDSQVCDSV